MEALATLSVAANVFQVVDFSACIVSKSSELYKSTHGQLVQHTDISTTSNDLERLTTKLSDSIAPQSVAIVPSEDDLALHTLCKGCIDVSTELQRGLRELQVSGAPSKWRSLRKALKTIWTKERISELQSRLAAYREQLDSRLLVGIKSQLDGLNLRQSEAFHDLDAGVKALVDALLNTSDKMELKIEQQAAITDAAMQSNVQRAQDKIVDAVDDARIAHQQRIHSVEGQLTAVQASTTQNLIVTQNLGNEVIESLAYSNAVNSNEHEDLKAELTQQWKSAEEQICQLREEIRQLETRIADSIQKAVSRGAMSEDKDQRRVNEQTNLLYKLLVAKDLMLQKLVVSSLSYLEVDTLYLQID